MKEAFSTKIEQQEEELEVEVFLKFFRHGPRETTPDIPDKHIEITEEGRRRAREIGEKHGSDASISVAFGSDRDRTKETAAHIMLARQKEISPNANLKEMEEKIEEFTPFKKITEDHRLSFYLNGATGLELKNAFKADQYLSVLINKSDDLAIEDGDKDTTTYIRQAGNIAEILAKYLKVADNMYRSRVKSEKNDDNLTKKLERYLGTHQRGCESLIAKCLEKISGSKVRDEFVESVGNGFKELEGMDVTIKQGVDGKKIVITYQWVTKKRHYP